MNLAKIVIDPRHFHEVTAGIDHFPPGQIVERGSPKHGFFATGIHRDVAANARGFGRGWVDGKHPIGGGSGFGNARRDNAGTGSDGRACLLYTSRCV